MISSSKLPPSGCLGPNVVVMTGTDSSSGSSGGRSSLNGELNDLRLHDGGFLLLGLGIKFQSVLNLMSAIGLTDA